jgi:hypothetical protein
MLWWVHLADAQHLQYLKEYQETSTIFVADEIIKIIKISPIGLLQLITQTNRVISSAEDKKEPDYGSYIPQNISSGLPKKERHYFVQVFREQERPRSPLL